jgi:hypothetical protein
MIREQLELFPKKIKKSKSIIVRQSNSNNFRGWNDVMTDIAKNFSISDRKYFAGMIDGDGTFNLHERKKRSKPVLRIGLELRHDHAEPLIKLAELFDLTISKFFRLDQKNTQPSLKIELSGVKGILFLFSIYPYLLEKKDRAKEILKKLECPKKYLSNKKQFSFEYLAGYTDAEGSVQFNLRHEKTKIGNITSCYRMSYMLTSNDNAHLQFIKQRLIDRGFDHFRKDYVATYKNVEKREGRNPETWKNTTHIQLGGSPKQLSKFYKNVEPFMLIKHKKDNMRHTISYNQITSIKFKKRK